MAVLVKSIFVFLAVTVLSIVLPPIGYLAGIILLIYGVWSYMRRRKAVEHGASESKNGRMIGRRLQTTTSAEQAPSPRGSKFCVSCGARVSEVDRFCQGCGARQPLENVAV